MHVYIKKKRENRMSKSQLRQILFKEYVPPNT